MRGESLFPKKILSGLSILPSTVLISKSIRYNLYCIRIKRYIIKMYKIGSKGE